MNTLISLGLDKLKPRGAKVGQVFLVTLPEISYDDADRAREHRKARAVMLDNLKKQYPTAMSMTPQSFFVSDEIGTTSRYVAERINGGPLRPEDDPQISVFQISHLYGWADKSVWEWFAAAMPHRF